MSAVAEHLPGLLGIELEHVGPELVTARLEIREELFAPTGYLHAATLVALADSACGYGALAGLLEGASGFTTVELKANLLATARTGVLYCTAHRRHGGSSTQVWDAEVRCGDRVLALFRCTQLILIARRQSAASIPAAPDDDTSPGT
jgi:1,4-dihydroxy-2-naphthoyl-CoA hydrolase